MSIYCKKCAKEITIWSTTGFCRGCWKRKPRLNAQQKASKTERIKKYKAEYFQKNKEKIYRRKLNNPAPKEKIRQYSFKYNYGISMQDYVTMLTTQNYRCAICDTPHLETKMGALRIDHNHSTGALRSLLCASCNSGIGYLKENIKIFESCIKYITKWNEN